jgi:hypothetical protein
MSQAGFALAESSSPADHTQLRTVALESGFQQFEFRSTIGETRVGHTVVLVSANVIFLVI